MHSSKFEFYFDEGMAGTIGAVVTDESGRANGTDGAPAVAGGGVVACRRMQEGFVSLREFIRDKAFSAAAHEPKRKHA